MNLPLREVSTEMIRVNVSLPFCRCRWCGVNIVARRLLLLFARVNYLPAKSKIKMPICFTCSILQMPFANDSALKLVALHQLQVRWRAIGSSL